MDNITIATLKDFQTPIGKSFEGIDKKIKSYAKGDKRQKISIKKNIQKELEYIKNNLEQMKIEMDKLKEEENINEWEEIYNKLESKRKAYKEKLNNLEIPKTNNDEENNEDYLDPDAKVDLNDLNVEQAMKRGDNILDADDNAIKNMNQIVNKDNDIMKGVNSELNRQGEQLGVADKDLKEMEFSIGRARKKITSMFKLYASDKCITCLIVVILLIIVIIIIVSACGGDNKKNFNVPHDIFGTNDKNITTSSSHYLTKSFILIRFIEFLLLYIL